MPGYRGVSSLAIPTSGVLLAAILLSIGYPTVNSDGYYYLTIARNVAESGTFTYDTLHSTNGFHWAWMALLIGISALLRVLGVALDGPEFVGVVTLVSGAFYAAAAGELARLLSAHPRLAHDTRMVWLLVGLVFLEPNLIALSINGLETPLFLFLLLRLVRLLSVQPSRGVLVTYIALTLTRIEGLVMAPFVVMHVGASWFSTLRRCAVAIAPVLLIVILNYLADGSILSNSSQAKSFWAGLAREAYFWDAPAGAKLNAIIRDAAYAPGVLWQLLLSIRDDRVLGIFAAVLLAAAGYVAFRKRAAVAGDLRWRPLFFLTWYCVVTWCAYKTVYFTPRSQEYFARFAVYDYQSIWYFAPLCLLMALTLQLILSSAGDRFATSAAPGICLVALLWLRAGAAFPAVGDQEYVQCEAAPTDAVYVAQNDDGFVYRHRLKLVVLDGLVTGRRFSSGVSYQSVLANGSLEESLAELSPSFVRVGTERLLTNAHVADSRVITLRSDPVIPLCAMGLWYQLNPGDVDGSPTNQEPRGEGGGS